MAAGRPGMSEETKSKILTLYAQGFSDNQIAAEVGCCGQNIYLFRRANGLRSNYDYKPRKQAIPKERESKGVHWSTVLTPDQWEVCRALFKAAISRKTFGRLSGVRQS